MDSKALIQLGKPEEALAALKKTVDLGPRGCPDAVPARGREPVPAAREVGRGPERHAEALRALGDPDAEDIAARAALGKGDFKARRARRPRRVREGLGQDEGARGSRPRPPRRHEERPRLRPEVGRRRRRRFRPATSSSSPASTCCAATCSPGRGARPRPRSEFLEEIRLYPDRLDARVSLSALYASVGRREDARRALIQLVARQPSPESFLLAMRTCRVTDDPQAEREMRREAKRRFPRDPRF